MKATVRNAGYIDYKVDDFHHRPELARKWYRVRVRAYHPANYWKLLEYNIIVDFKDFGKLHILQRRLSELLAALEKQRKEKE